MTTTQTESPVQEVSSDGLASEATVWSPPPQVVYVEADALLRPIFLEVEHTQDGQVVVSDSALIAYGTGRDLEEAVSDFIDMLFELRDELEGSQLSRRLRRQLSAVRQVLGRTH